MSRVLAPAPTPSRARRLLIGALLGCLAAVCLGLAAQGRLDVERLVGLSAAPAPAAAVSAPAPAPLPTLAQVSHDSAGSSIDSATYHSAALGHAGSFFVYLPRGYASTTRHYPVLYLLHGNSQPASAFLEIGLQEELDSLIATHRVAPMIAVMIQGGPGSNNWRNVGREHYESYVLEVQELIDRMLPTIAARRDRAIAGDSMGGYGAMNIALGNPLPLRRRGELAGLLRRSRRRAPRRPPDHRPARPARVHLRRRRRQDRRPGRERAVRQRRCARRAPAPTARCTLANTTWKRSQAHLASMLTFAGHALAKAAPRGGA